MGERRAEGRARQAGEAAAACSASGDAAEPDADGEFGQRADDQPDAEADAEQRRAPMRRRRTAP